MKIIVEDKQYRDYKKVCKLMEKYKDIQNEIKKMNEEMERVEFIINDICFSIVEDKESDYVEE